MIVITAALKAKPGKDSEMIAAMKELAAAVKAREKDTLDYTLLRSQKNPLLFLVYEKYRHAEAMKAHLASPHFQAAAKKFAPLLDAPLSAESYEVVE